MKSFRSVQLNLTFLVVGCCLSVYARPDGAPAEACSTMTPSHGVGWQENKCPFEISVDQTIIYQGKNLNIKLAVKSDVGVDDPYAQGFKGFMIMVVDAATLKTEPLGVFSDLVTAGKTMDCPNAAKGAVTHSNNDFKKYVEVVWTSPADYLGDVLVMVTFVHEKEIHWVRENSKPVAIRPVPDESSSTATSPITTTATTTPTTTTPTTTKVTTTITTTTPAAASRLSVAEWTTLFSVAIMSFYIFNRF